MSRTNVRDNKGRFRPGVSGNPAGKKPGTRNRSTILREVLRDAMDPSLARAIIAKALGGDGEAIGSLLERLEAHPLARAIRVLKALKRGQMLRRRNEKLPVRGDGRPSLMANPSSRQWSSVGAEQYVPPRRTRTVPRVVSQRRR